MSATVAQYVLAADRDNTVKSYAAALRNFEEVWKGLLPATADTVARYLAEHAEIYRLSTLRLHLAALARWHADNGFADPTRSPLVHKVLRGIRAKHAVPQKHARPLQLDVLEDVSGWLLKAHVNAGQDPTLFAGEDAVLQQAGPTGPVVWGGASPCRGRACLAALQGGQAGSGVQTGAGSRRLCGAAALVAQARRGTTRAMPKKVGAAAV